jgi:hypothetical protein
MESKPCLWHGSENRLIAHHNSLNIFRYLHIFEALSARLIYLDVFPICCKLQCLDGSKPLNNLKEIKDIEALKTAPS